MKEDADPMHVWRRKEKQRIQKAKKKTRQEQLAEVPAHRRDAAPLVSEIYRLSVLEYEGKANSDLRMRKKHLLDQYRSIEKARRLAGLETIALAEFDPEAYEAAKLRRSKEQDAPKPKPRLQHEPTTIARPDLDETGLSKLPDGPAPSNEQLISLNLPPYSAFAHVTDSECFLQKDPDDCENDHPVDDLEAQLEAEYAAFKESLGDES